MERLTDCAQGYCEMYCKEYEHCFGDPEGCIFKDEIKLYDALKSIEGIVPLDRLLELACADKDGRLAVLPCKVGDTVYVINRHKNRVFECNIISIGVGRSTDLKNYIKTKWVGPNGNESIRKWSFRQVGKYVFLTREEAEAALSNVNTIPCKHGISRHRNEIGEDEVYCELNAKWMNVSLGDCLGNCESEAALAWKGGNG